MSDNQENIKNQEVTDNSLDAGMVAAEAIPLTVEQQLSAAEAKIVDLTAQVAHAQDQFLRAKAESDNTRRRAQLDIGNAHKYASENFAESLLPVKDSLEAALAHGDGATLEKYKEGVELTLKQLVAAFDKGKVQEINPVGEKFDPHKHQAISMVPAPESTAANHVVNVLQKGYQISERILRPALVTVAQA